MSKQSSVTQKLKKTKTKNKTYKKRSIFQFTKFHGNYHVTYLKVFFKSPPNYNNHLVFDNDILL